MDLQEIRVEIDKTDKEIIGLYEKRLALVNKVAEYKIANNKPVYDEKREQEKKDNNPEDKKKRDRCRNRYDLR